MKNLKFFLSLIFFNLILINPSYSFEKIVILDLDDLLKKTNHGKKIIEELNLINEKNLLTLKKIEEKIKANQEEIKTQKNLLSEEELSDKVKNLNSEILDFQNKKNTLASDFNSIKKNKLDDFFKKIIPEIEDYISKNNISLVFDKKNIFIANKKINITNDIIKIIDEKLKW